MKTLQDYEQLVHDALDANDPDTLDHYTEHAIDNLDGDHLRSMVLAMIRRDDAGKALALIKIESLIDQQRAEFMEFEALRRAKLAEEHEDRLADLDASLRGAA